MPNSVISPSDQRQFVNLTVISNILRSNDFTVFGGDPVANLGDMAAAGTLEGRPHNFVHRWVGGDMVTVGSPYDPIFWLHHCNVDRLWSEWIRRHPDGMPNDTVWLDTPFKNHFCDRKGALIATTSDDTPITTRQMLVSEDLGYRYDRRMTAVKFRLVAPELIIRTPGPTENLAAAKFDDGVENFHLTSNPDLSQRVNTAVEKNVPETVRLRLKGITVPANSDVAIQVFINCVKPDKGIPITDPSYATSVTFFHGGHDGERTVSFVADITPTLARLYADRPFKADEPIKITLIAKPLFPDRANPWKGEIRELSPTQVSIDVVGPKK
jgi:hypothetical protein